MSARNGYSDPLVVSTRELAAVLQRWIDEHRADHPIGEFAEGRGNNAVNFGEQTWYGDYLEEYRAEPVTHYGAMEFLANSLSRDARVFRRILRVETQYTSLEVCDKILQLIERTDATHTGEIHVVPNPYWNQERWIEWYLAERRGC
jgi:hypothetical protein